MEDSKRRARPNILVTGTPGTGKTTTSEMIAARVQLKHINVSELIKQQELHEGKDEAFDTFIVDEDKVYSCLLVKFHIHCCAQLIDEMEDLMEEGGNVVDFHSADIFPERWFDLVLVLTTRTDVLYDRLQKR
jgi:adenylate kinase